MFVNQVAFLVTISRNIHFGTAEKLQSRKEGDVMKALTDVVKLYKLRGFKVETFLSDGEFKPIRSKLYELGGVLNITANDEHVGDVERYIQTIKERAQLRFT
jgi:hypothetical protein